MGDMADQYEMRDYFEDVAFLKATQDISSKIWTTKCSLGCIVGDKINVKDMTTSHIQNCIKCLEDGRISFDFGSSINEEWIEVFKKELFNR